MEGGKRSEELRALKELKREQEEILKSAAELWGAINEQHGSQLLEEFVREGRIQSYVLAAHGSEVDTEEHTDAAPLLWNHAYMPLNFKSSKTGKAKHDSKYPDRPSLVINTVCDPELKEARQDLLRLIEEWYGHFTFKNGMLVPRFCRMNKEMFTYLLNEAVEYLLGCDRLVVGEIGGKELRLSGLHQIGYKRKGGKSNQGRRKKRTECVEAFLELSNGAVVSIEFYLGSKLFLWFGKKNQILIVLPREHADAEEFKKVFATGIMQHISRAK